MRNSKKVWSPSSPGNVWSGLSAFLKYFLPNVRESLGKVADERHTGISYFGMVLYVLWRLKRKWLVFQSPWTACVSVFPWRGEGQWKRRSYLMSTRVRACMPATTAEQPTCSTFTPLCGKCTSCFVVSCLFLSITWLWFFKIIFHFSYTGVKMYVDFFCQGWEELVLLNQNKAVSCTYTGLPAAWCWIGLS